MDTGLFIHAVISDQYANTDELQAGRVRAYHYDLGIASAERRRGTSLIDGENSFLMHTFLAFCRYEILR